VQPLEGIEIIPACLPVDRALAPTALVQAIDACQPEGVLCLGQASGRSAISIERLAVNLLDFSIPDNAGMQAVDEPVVPGGPAAYFVTLPVRRVLRAIQQEGIPAGLSLTAGAYLCNQVLYVLLHTLTERGLDIPAGFIHLPALPEQAAQAKNSMPSMSVETSIIAVKAAIMAMVQTESYAD
jgi:pyroglutamyl-peptidase